jgi:hypothetical protein
VLAAFDQSMETIRSAVVGSPPFWLRHIASTLAARDVGRDCLEREQVRDRTQIASPKALITPRLRPDFILDLISEGPPHPEIASLVCRRRSPRATRRSPLLRTLGAAKALWW